MRDLQPLVAPRSVAVVGASSNVTKSGGVLFKNIVDGGFAGPVHPINPRAGEILGRRAYPSLRAVPEPVDLVFVVVPQAAVRAALEDCIASRARAACIVTGGFAEAGEDGRRLQDDLRELVREAGLLTIGPNTIGTVNAECRLMGSFTPFPDWLAGPVAIFCQTGIFAGAAMVQFMGQEVQRFGIGKSIDAGNKIDVDELDFLRFAAEDPGTRIIGLHVEDVREPDAFFALAARVAREKPIVVLKPGRTPLGSAAAAYHTASGPMDDRELDAALRSAGVVRADDVEDFLGFLKAFAYLPLPKGRRVGVVTYSGALGVMAMDDLAAAGLPAARFSPGTLEAVSKVVYAWQPLVNPLDMWAAIDAAGPRAAHEVPLDAALGDPGVDMVLALPLTPANADFPETREVFARLRERHPDTPLAMVVTGGAIRERWLRDIDGLGIPVYPTTRAAVRALAALAAWREHRDRG
jgi:acetyltransferase